MTDWIKVEEQLPTIKNKWIAVLINDMPIIAEVHNFSFTQAKDEVSFYWPRDLWIKDTRFAEITHWMPLVERKMPY